MEQKYWAQRRGKKCGPFATREQALSEFRKAYPFKGKPWEARAPRNLITTGYGEGDAWFSIELYNAAAEL